MPSLITRRNYKVVVDASMQALYWGNHGQISLMREINDDMISIITLAYSFKVVHKTINADMSII